MLALADGMGGHAAGEVASQLLINALRPLDSPLLDEPTMHDRLTTLLATAMDEGNQAIALHVDENPQLEGMGCTLSTLLFRNNEAALCHVGDSRGYLLRDGELQQITKDDTFVQSLVDEGKLAAEDVSNHPQRSLILKALTGRPVEPTLSTFQVKAGDRFMLCSDGLSDPVSFDTIHEALSTGTPDHSARRLVELALRSGGPDNVTVVIGDVIEFDAASNHATDPSITLPAAPIVAGAVAGKVTDTERPNTAASRAAALNLQTTSRPAQSAGDGDGAGAGSGDSADQSDKAAAGAVGSEASDSAGTGRPATEATDSAQADGAGASEAAGAAGAAAAGAGARKASRSKGRGRDVNLGVDDHKNSHPRTDEQPAVSAEPARGRKKKRGLTIALIVALVILAGLATSGYILWNNAKNSYYVAEEDGRIAIYNGKRDSILGNTLNSKYQEICLAENQKVTTYPAGTKAPKMGSKDCHHFRTDDLTPVARGAISNLPNTTYDEALNQVHRLAERTLPACVTRTSNSSNPEDLTTPGVSCREVK
ncbi:serine/threonine-protein phosphatase [Corynebacterium sp. 320]|nr:serine/threonine-protein phosphatase [Corynebacterium sp. 320]KAB1550559.1 serine/threonine-protein phosphatase [Corynebacterium sp. 319]KAB1554866.1 serine/threonine-protein phosphatase [Corynebacterium sp. 321]KAB3526585.1 serine/threonine-protein phosphatase [Corynebacterium sp. 250]KAB3540818.1 serine/threonine-protein phosphatase [Corynebacterium sp. 366]